MRSARLFPQRPTEVFMALRCSYASISVKREIFWPDHSSAKREAGAREHGEGIAADSWPSGPPGALQKTPPRNGSAFAIRQLREDDRCTVIVGCERSGGPRHRKLRCGARQLHAIQPSENLGKDSRNGIHFRSRMIRTLHSKTKSATPLPSRYSRSMHRLRNSIRRLLSRAK